MNVGELFAVLDINMGPFTGKLNEAQAKLMETGHGMKNMEGAAMGLASSLKTGVVAAIGAVVTGLALMGLETFKESEHLRNLAYSTGLSTDYLQKLRYIANTTGLEFESIAKSALMLQRRLMGLEEGTGNPSKAMAQLFGGKDVIHDTTGELKSMNEIFPMLISRLQQVENPSKKAELATQLFGRSVGELQPILHMTKEEMDKITAHAPLFSKKDIDDMATFVELQKRMVESAKHDAATQALGAAKFFAGLRWAGDVMEAKLDRMLGWKGRAKYLEQDAKNIRELFKDAADAGKHAGDAEAKDYDTLSKSIYDVMAANRKRWSEEEKHEVRWMGAGDLYKRAQEAGVSHYTKGPGEVSDSDLKNTPYLVEIAKHIKEQKDIQAKLLEVTTSKLGAYA